MQPGIIIRPATHSTIHPLHAGGATSTGVLVVGGGPTGLALACDLRSRGIDVTIIDKALGPATTSRALGVQPRGIEILDRLGALGDLPRRAVKARGLNILAGRRQLVRIDFPAVAGVTTPGPLLIGQSQVEGQLRARLAEFGRRVLWGTEIVGAREGEDKIKITLNTPEGEHVVFADWLVGCDGAHSRTRKLAGIAFEGTSFSEQFLLADVRLDWNRSHLEPAVWLHRDGVFAALPLPGPDVWRVMAELPRDLDGVADNGGGSITDDAAIELLQRLLKERLDDATTRVSDPSWVSSFRFHRRLASSYRRGRILIAGDAAHIHSPFGGQGMNTGLGDAYNLGWKLAMVMHGRAGERLLDSYEAERRPVAADVLKTTTDNTNLLLANSAAARLLRDYWMLPMMKLPAVQRKLAANGSQLDVSYRNGPLARPAGAFSRLARAVRAGPRAGDRGPNARCLVEPAAEPTTLADQTSSGWALLLFGGAGDDVAACTAAARSRLGEGVRVVRILRRGEAAAKDDAKCADVVLLDHTGEMARLYRPRASEVVLLRPDGHLAWRAWHPAAADLREWLSTVLDASRPPRGLRTALHRRAGAPAGASAHATA